MAAATECKFCYGIEKADVPADYAEVCTEIKSCCGRSTFLCCVFPHESIISSAACCGGLPRFHVSRSSHICKYMSVQRVLVSIRLETIAM